MKKNQKIKLLERLVEKSKDIKTYISSDPEFKSWKNMVERTLSNIYGDSSKELKQFEQLGFYYNGIRLSGKDYSQNHLSCFDRAFETALKIIETLIEEIKYFEIGEVDDAIESANYKRIFISHSSKDKQIVEEFVDILESSGLLPNKIFCSSLKGYGIPLGDSPIEILKNEISKDVLVLFILTENFYKSAPCLCEMGAAWALSKENIPIIVPPFTFEQIKGLLPVVQGISITNELELNLLHDKMLRLFNLPEQPMSAWERKRDRAIARINQILADGNAK